MTRKLTLRRPRILAGFMLLFEASIGEGAQVLANGSVLEFPLTEGEHTLTLTTMNNPNVKAPDPLSIPAGEQNYSAVLVCRSVNGAARWDLELE